MVQYGVEGSSTFLECQARSPHALIKWHLQRDNSDRRKEVSPGAQRSSFLSQPESLKEKEAELQPGLSCDGKSRKLPLLGW